MVKRYRQNRTFQKKEKKKKENSIYNWKEMTPKYTNKRMLEKLNDFRLKHDNQKQNEKTNG